MLEDFYIERSKLRILRKGPIGPFIDDFVKRLEDQGFTGTTIVLKLGVLVSLSEWLMTERIALSEFDEKRIGEFIAYKKEDSPQFSRNGNETIILSFLDSLRTHKAIPEKKSVSLTELQRHIANYRRYIENECGLAVTTSRNYADCLQLFLSREFGVGPVRLEKLRPEDVVKFLIDYGARYSVKRTQFMATSLKRYFKLMKYREEIQLDLANIVPSIAQWQNDRLPEILTEEELKRILSSCDRTTFNGKRDFAVLLLLIQTGMRANEVTKLTIDDIDWEKGEMTLHCKGRHKKRFPVMNDVGKALVDYLKHARPKTECRNVFVVIRAPRNAFKSGVGAIVTRAMLRAGIKSYKKGSHILRHTVASQMLRQGATLPEVGEVLHHRSLKTTAIYAKVDYGRLREISRPWPTGNGGAK